MQKINLLNKLLFLFVFTLLIKTGTAQTGLNFQGVARSSTNAVLVSQAITIKLTILQGSATGTAEYTETRKVTTNAQGLFTAVIGDAGALSNIGDFATINWKLTPKFLKIEMDPAAGANFITMGTTQFQSVAYAQFANSVAAENIAGILPVSSGGTGLSSLTAFKTALAIDKINNTADVDKPLSTSTQMALALKANTTDVTTSLATKVDKVSGKDLSTNDYTTTEKSKLAAITGANTGDQDLSLYATTASVALKVNTTDISASLDTKVDKVIGKNLSTNDFSNTEKNKLAAIIGANTGDQDLSLLATSASVALKANTSDINASLDTKVDKVIGKDLSSNDFSTTEKNKLAAIIGANTGDQDLSLLATSASVALKANTSDINTSLALKENQSNKSADVLLGGTDANDILYPTQKAVKAYVAANTASGGIADGGITTIKLADLAVTDSKIADVAASKITGTLGVAHGGTGATTLTGIVKGNGTGAFTAATAGTDYLMPDGSAANLNSFPTLNQNTTGNAATATTAITAGNITAASNSTLTSLPNLALVGTISSGTISLTTDIKTSGAITAGTVTYLNTHGTSGQVLSTTGSGTLTWTTISGGSGVPYTGATGAVNLGAYDLKVNGLIIGKGGGSQLNNTAVGVSALNLNTSGDYNTAFGGGALVSNIIGTGNTAIGAGADVAFDNLTNATVIGSGASVIRSNFIQLGNRSVENVSTYGTLTAGDVTYPKTHGTANQVLKTTGTGTLSWATVSGGVSSVESISGTSNVKGATISGTTLTLTPADASNGGIVTTGVQTFVGAKTFSGTVSANTLGVGINAPNASAVLEASSSTQGFLPPRMTLEQRIAITSPAQGLMIYCTNCGANGEPEYYNGNAWMNFAGTATSKSTPTINITVGTYTFTTSTSQGPNSATNSGTGSTYAYTYLGTGSTTYASSATRPTNAGTYSVTVSLSASGDGNYNAATASAAFTIAQAIPTVTPTIGTYNYSGTEQGPTIATNTGTGTSYTYSYTGTSFTTYGPSSTKPKDGGTYTVKGTVAASSDGNYTAASSSPTAFKIALNLSLGNSYGGGTVAYILKLGDIGYDPLQQHGLIISVDLTASNTSIIWGTEGVLIGATGGFDNFTPPNGTSTFVELGAGINNTNLIIASEGTVISYAARLAKAYNGGLYTNWYLPSFSELYGISLNRLNLGTNTYTYHWTSTEEDQNNAKLVTLGSGNLYALAKGFANGGVRAVRVF